MARRLNLSDEDHARIKFETIDDAQGDEACFVILDMVITITPAFVAELFRLTLGLSRRIVFAATRSLLRKCRSHSNQSYGVAGHCSPCCNDDIPAHGTETAESRKYRQTTGSKAAAAQGRTQVSRFRRHEDAVWTRCQYISLYHGRTLQPPHEDGLCDHSVVIVLRTFSQGTRTHSRPLPCSWIRRIPFRHTRRSANVICWQRLTPVI